MKELSLAEAQAVSGGQLDGYTGASLIVGVASLAATPIVIGVALGAAGGLLIAQLLADLDSE